MMKKVVVSKLQTDYHLRQFPDLYHIMRVYLGRNAGIFSHILTPSAHFLLATLTYIFEFWLGDCCIWRWLLLVWLLVLLLIRLLLIWMLVLLLIWLLMWTTFFISTEEYIVIWILLQYYIFAHFGIVQFARAYWTWIWESCTCDGRCCNCHCLIISISTRIR